MAEAARYVPDPPPGVTVTLADSYGLPVRVSHGGGEVTLTMGAGCSRVFGAVARNELMRALVAAEHAEEAAGHG